MVESIGNVQPQSVQVKKDNAGRNAAIAGGVGLVGGGATGYLTKQIFKDDKFTDEFVKETAKDFLAKVSDDKHERKVLQALYDIEDNPSIDTIKKFFKNNKKHLEKIGDESAIDILKKSDDEIMSAFLDLKTDFNENIKTTLDQIPDDLLNLFDKTKKKFVFPEGMKNDEICKAAQHTMQKLKGKAGLIWGVTAGTVLGIGAFIASKLGGSNKQA